MLIGLKNVKKRLKQSFLAKTRAAQLKKINGRSKIVHKDVIGKLQGFL
jgi:hypothetical protein